MTLIMGVLNVTPDSFSDGGRWLDPDTAVARGLELRDEGAEIVDVGGESTRPGSEPVDPEEEQRRVLPVVAALAAQGVAVSIDTRNASTARLAIEAGASIVNDVSAGAADDAMARVVAEAGVEYVAMHSRGPAGRPAEYGDVVADVRADLKARVAALVVAGVEPERIIVDPGLGFSKTAEHNWALLWRLGELASLGHRVLVGHSRKRFIGAMLPPDAAMEARDLPTAVVSALAADAGAWGVRVHDVRSTRIALDVQDRMRTG